MSSPGPLVRKRRESALVEGQGADTVRGAAGAIRARRRGILSIRGLKGGRCPFSGGCRSEASGIT